MPVAVAKDGFGPDGRKKLKNAGVPTNFPSKEASGQPTRRPEPAAQPHARRRYSGPFCPGAKPEPAATTVTGLVNPRPAASAFCRLVASNYWIGGVDVHRTIEFQSAGVLVTDADFPRAGDFPFNGEVALLRVAEAEVFRYRQGEGQNRQRKTSRQIILIGKQGIRRSKGSKRCSLDR